MSQPLPATRQLADKVTANVGRVIVGKAAVVELTLVALLANGHVLLEDVPGIGKTSLAKSLARSLNCSFGRIQFTPDLLPADVVGVTFYHQQSGEFVFRPGPVQANILLADEINRATPRTQASLLECMEERQVTVDGVSHFLPRPFLVLATQNPVELEGTFPLPEAQLDRFLLRLSLGYPSEAEEQQLLITHAAAQPLASLQPVAELSEVLASQQECRQVRMVEAVRQYLTALVRATRQHDEILLGASPRASLGLFHACQALAALRGRDYVLPDDVKQLFIAVVAHRLLLQPQARLRGRTAALILEELLAATPAPVETLPA